MCVTGPGEVLEGYRLRDPDNGLIMPWYTWPCLEWLNGLDLKGKKIFEYGVGDSTLWYKGMGALTFGIDSNCEWGSLAGVDWTRDKHKYTHAIYWITEYFDFVVIDGIHRDDCTKHAIISLKRGGYLIIDNFHQPSVEPNIWTETDKLIEGMPITIYKQPGHDDWSTAVITKP